MTIHDHWEFVESNGHHKTLISASWHDWEQIVNTSKEANKQCVIVAHRLRVTKDCLRNFTLAVYKPSRRNLFLTALYNLLIWNHGLNINCNRCFTLAISAQLAGFPLNILRADSNIFSLFPVSFFLSSSLPPFSRSLSGLCEQNSVWNVVRPGSWLLCWGVCPSTLSACMIITQSHTHSGLSPSFAFMSLL